MHLQQILSRRCALMIRLIQMFPVVLSDRCSEVLVRSLIGDEFIYEVGTRDLVDIGNCGPR